MNYLSVCSGIEAATVAWHHMGWKPVGFSEIEKFPSQVLEHHYPQVTNFGDMTKYKEWKLDDSIGLLVGGTPCQSFSVAGLRKGLDDPRGNLALTYVGILDKFRPKWCVWENVPGVLSSGNGRDFGSLLGALVELGYGFSYRVLDAQNFGVAQRRRRVFVVGYLGDWRPTAKVLFESESLRWDIKKGRSKKQETAAFTPSSFGQYSEGVGTLRSAGGDLGGGSETLYVPNVDNCLQTTCDDYSRADGFNMVVNSIGFTQCDAARDVGYEVSPTLRSGGNGGYPNHAVSYAMSVRKLTEVECERLQGFPDNYTNIKDNCPSGARYKALGNSMAVPVMRWIGDRINLINKAQKK
jgi:DNA (cytosine-5)-methyltransferase 1